MFKCHSLISVFSILVVGHFLSSNAHESISSAYLLWTLNTNQQPKIKENKMKSILTYDGPLLFEGP